MGRRKAAVSANGHTYQSLVDETRELILNPKWVTIGKSVHIATIVFGKTIVQFHKDLFREYFKAEEKLPMTSANMGACHTAYKFRENCSPEMREVTASKAPFYFAALDKTYRESKQTTADADKALKKVLRQEGGIRRLTRQLQVIISAASLLEAHPELLVELDQVTVNNAVKALSTLIQALKQVSTKTRKTRSRKVA